MKKINNKLNISILIIVTIIVLYSSLKDNFIDVVHGFGTLNIFWVIIALIFVLGYYYLRSLSLYVISKKFSDHITFKKILRMVLITQFFDGITPSSSGGQPYQIYALTKENINIMKSTNITIQNFIVYQIALILLGLVAVVSNNYFNLFESVGFIKKLILLGFIINVIVIIGLFSLAFVQKINKFIIKITVILFSKLKIIKNKDKILENLNQYIETFHNSSIELLKSKKILIQSIIYNIIGLILLYTVPLLIIYGLGIYNHINIFESIISSAYVMLIGSFIPIPGATGGIEYAFTQFYGVFIKDAHLTLVMIMWRFITYYLGMIIGGILLNIRKKRVM